MHLKNLENTHRPFCSGLKMKNLEYNVLNASIANIVDIIVIVILEFSLIHTEYAAVCRAGIHLLQNLILAPKKITLRLENLALFVELTLRYKMIKRMELKTERGIFRGAIMNTEEAEKRGYGYYFTNRNKHTGEYDYEIWTKHEPDTLNFPLIAFVKYIKPNY